MVARLNTSANSVFPTQRTAVGLLRRKHAKRYINKALQDLNFPLDLAALYFFILGYQQMSVKI